MANRRKKIENYDDALRELTMAIDWARSNGYHNVLSHLIQSRIIFLQYRDEKLFDPNARNEKVGQDDLLFARLIQIARMFRHHRLQPLVDDLRIEPHR
jgi:hypothetical protein